MSASFDEAPSARLVRVEKRPSIVHLPFSIFIAVLISIGMTGVVVLSNIIQNQSENLAALQSEESELRYQEAGLSAQAQDLRSSQNLATRAWDLGMRPNPNPAFILMPSKTIKGQADPVVGNELPFMVPHNSSQKDDNAGTGFIPGRQGEIEEVSPSPSLEPSGSASAPSSAQPSASSQEGR